MKGRFWLNKRRTLLVATFLSFISLSGYYILLRETSRERVTVQRSIDESMLSFPLAVETDQQTEQQTTVTFLSNISIHLTPNRPFVNDNCNETIHIAIVVVTDRERTSTLPLLVLLKSILVNRHLPLHLHFLSDSIANDTIHRLLSTWNIPYFKWTIYCTPQTQSIPSIVYGNILLNMLLPPSIDAFIVMNIDSLVIKDLGKLWHYVQQPQTTRVITMDDFKSNILLTKRRSLTSVLRIISDTQYRPELSPNDLVDMFSELPMIVPCNIDQTFVCQTFVMLQQLEYGDNKIQHAKTHSTLFYDGDALPQKIVSKCSKHIALSPTAINPIMKLNASSNDSYCNDLVEIAEYKYRILLHFYGKYYSSDDTHDVTLVTQLTFDRLSLLPVFLTHWTGPASIALYIADEQLEKVYNFLNSTVIINERARENLAIHIVFNHSLIYPINYIRNVALDAVTTPYVFLNDFDLLPNYGCYLLMKRAIRKYNLNAHKKIALVIPAFETVGNDTYKVPFPISKQELVSLIKTKKATQFHLRISRAHKPTSYKKWKMATRPYRARYRSDYEPYILVRNDVVRYNTRFVGYGWNKVSQIMELHAQSYKFVVHPYLFVLHEWHPVSLQKKIFWSEEFQICLKKQKDDFYDDLVSKYGHFIT